MINSDDKVYAEERALLTPVRILDSRGVEGAEKLLEKKAGAVLYRRPDLASVWSGKGSYVLLDFGKELCGSARIVVCKAKAPARFRICFGESVSEALSHVGEKNATNDHSPRDFEITLVKMSDNTFGKTGFRFLYLELLEDVEVKIQDVLCESVSAGFEREGCFESGDPLLDEIVKTSAHTLRLCYQNGYLLDGIKRDRLVWCGDLHPEILTGLYWFGDMPHVRNSLELFRDYTPSDEWINNIPSYSAWWIVNLAEYVSITGNTDFLRENLDYAHATLSHMRQGVSADGTVSFEGDRPLNYFLDWSTHGKEESAVGVAALFLLAAKKWLSLEENEDARAIVNALSPCVKMDSETKPVRAFQVLAGREDARDAAFLEKNGSEGFSTFMAYYILSAAAKAGGESMLSTLKEYYGGMLSRGATTFWEDFDLSWLKDSGRIDALPKSNEKDIHGDFGRYCYEGFRHSLCHGWSSGVLSFVVEYVLGIRVLSGGKKISFSPHSCGLERLKASIPFGDGDKRVSVSLEGGKWSIFVPDGISVEYL